MSVGNGNLHSRIHPRHQRLDDGSHRTVKLKKGAETLQDSSPGNGAVDAAMQAIDRIVKRRGHLAQYSVEAVTQGRDSLGEVTLKVDFGNGELITGKGASTDVIEASARAYH